MKYSRQHQWEREKGILIITGLFYLMNFGVSLFFHPLMDNPIGNNSLRIGIFLILIVVSLLFFAKSLRMRPGSTITLPYISGLVTVVIASSMSDMNSLEILIPMVLTMLAYAFAPGRLPGSPLYNGKEVI